MSCQSVDYHQAQMHLHSHVVSKFSSVQTVSMLLVSAMAPALAHTDAMLPSSVAV